MPASQPPDIAVTRVDADDPATIELVVAAGSDRAAHHNTYLPETPTREQARAWLAGLGGHIWRIDTGVSTVGLIAAHPPISDGVPAGMLETCTYLVPGARGQQIASRAWQLAEAELAGRCAGLAGVVWEDNIAGWRRLARDGYAQTDRIYYRDATSAGWCNVWVKPAVALTRAS